MASNDSTKNLNLRNPDAYRVYSKRELVRYTRFPKLYGEMKYARPLVPMNLSFFDLPTELRVKIYEYALVLPDAIEFRAETGYCYNNYSARKRAIRRVLSLIAHRDLNLGLLRTCKRINAEAAQVFYGENEFRFSGINGAVVAAAFLYHINVHHMHWIKNITIGMPFECEQQGPYSAGWTATHPRHFKNLRDFIPFIIPRHPHSWMTGYDRAVRFLLRTLAACQLLKKLTLVIPEHYMHIYGAKSEKKMKVDFEALVKAKPGLEIELLRMCHPESEAIFAVPEHQVETIKWFKSLTQCTFNGAYFDNHGKWVAGEAFDFSV